MRSIQGRNLDVLHYPGRDGRGDYWSTWVWYIQPCDELPMEDIEFENIRIDNRDGAHNLIKIQPMIRTESNWNGIRPGKYVKNVLFKNVSLTGSTAAKAPGVIYVSGADPKCRNMLLPSRSESMRPISSSSVPRATPTRLPSREKPVMNCAGEPQIG